MRRFLNISRGAVVVASLLALTGCGEKQSDQSRAPLTRAQRDSVLAASQLPGAAAVGKALAVSDSATARAERINNAAAGE
jgi:hypothetical protein